MTTRDPALLTPEERRAELGAVLATGYRRLQIRRSDDPQHQPATNQAQDAVMARGGRL